MDIQKVLLDMREYRMGLIQTPDQLRFSYMAVIEGARIVVTDNAEAQVALSRALLFGAQAVEYNLTNELRCQSDRLLYSETFGPPVVNRPTLWAETECTNYFEPNSKGRQRLE